jgi:hypothetical protein
MTGKTLLRSPQKSDESECMISQFLTAYQPDSAPERPPRKKRFFPRIISEISKTRTRRARGGLKSPMKSKKVVQGVMRRP